MQQSKPNLTLDEYLKLSSEQRKALPHEVRSEMRALLAVQAINQSARAQKS